MDQYIYISFHGGSKGSSYNNIHVYDLSGNELGKAIDKDTLPDWVTLDELRGFTIGPDGLLYVANAYKDYSNIVRFSYNGTQWVYDSVFAQGNTQQNPGLFHPYSVAFGPDGNLYTSSQDTDLVSRFCGPNSACPGNPLPSIVEGFPSGTFISFQKNFTTGAFGIRGINFDPDNNLYIANEDCNCVYVYDINGSLIKTIESTSSVTIDSPVQVQFDPSGVLYIGSSGNNAIITYENGKLNYFTGPNGEKLDAVSGIGFDSSNNMYVSSRKGKKILKYELPDNTPHSLIKDLSDNPEFVKIMNI